MDKIILASQSPRRRELLTQIGLVYQVIPSTVEEVITETDPKLVVQELSRQKAEDVAGSVLRDRIMREQWGEGYRGSGKWPGRNSGDRGGYGGFLPGADPGETR